MRYLEGGEVMLGSPEPNKDAQRFGTSSQSPPARKATIEAFWVAETEVTQGQFKALMGYNPAAQHPERQCEQGKLGDTLPVVCVTWFEALRYCNALSKREKKGIVYKIDRQNVRIQAKSTEGYRLLSGDEWEYAAKSGQDLIYAGTSQDKELCLFANVNDGLADCRSKHAGLAPVASYRPNAWGLYDFSGNAEEWVADWRHQGSHREVRGGSYDMHPYQFTRVYARAGRIPTHRDNARGFRVALRDGS